MNDSRSSTFSIKYPSSIYSIVSLIIIAALQSFLLYLYVENDGDLGILLYAVIGSIAVCCVVIAIYTRSVVKRPSELVIDAQSISLHNRIIEAGEIERVMIQGYFKQIIGIKPFGSKIVPVSLCFRILNNEDMAIKELSRWAEQHQIPVVHKRFIRWL
ncbi:hypothetical protein D3C78_808920 [compost metagenome]